MTKYAFAAVLAVLLASPVIPLSPKLAPGGGHCLWIRPHSQTNNAP